MEFRRSMGKKFEERGDYRNALLSYESAGITEGAERMRKITRILDMADLFISHGEFGRMAELLVESGLQKSGLDYLKKLEGIRRDHRVTHAKAVIFAANGQMREALGCIHELMSCNYWTRYLAGRLSTGRDAKFAEKVADYLSRKDPELGHLAEAFNDFAIKRGMVEKGEKSPIVAVLMSFMEVYEEDEGTFYALEIYKKIGKDKEAERCLGKLDRLNQELYFCGVAALKGHEGVRELDAENELVHVLLQVTGGNIDGAISRMEETPIEDCYGIIEAFSKVDSWLPNAFSHEQAARLIVQGDRVRGMRAKYASSHIEEFERLLLGGFEDIKKARKMLDLIKLEHLYAPSPGEPNDIHHGKWELYNKYILMAADAASRFSKDAEALEFAAGIFGRRDTGKAFECADRIYAIGQYEKAKKLYAEAAPGLSKKEKGKERVASRALELESERPSISLILYDAADDREGMLRVASKLIESSDIADVEQAAWRLTTQGKQGMLLKGALDRLESFGEAGKSKADMIRLEMGIGHLFLAK